MPPAYPDVDITQYLDVRSGPLRGIANVRLPDLGLTFPEVEIHERDGQRRAEFLPRSASGPHGSLDSPDVAEAFSIAVLAAAAYFLLHCQRPACASTPPA